MHQFVHGKKEYILWCSMGGVAYFQMAKVLVGLYNGRSISLHLPIMGICTVLGEGEWRRGDVMKKDKVLGICIQSSGKQGHIGIF